LKLLFEASVVFQMLEKEDGEVILSANIVSDELTPEATHASAAALCAAAAFRLFQDGTLNNVIRDQFQVPMEVTNGSQS
jgi:hypothetical protein